MADENKNPGSKQGDGDASDSFKANPKDKQGSGSTGGRSGRSGQSDGMDKSKSGSSGSSGQSGYDASRTETNDEGDIERPDDDSSKRSGSTNT